MIMRQPVHRNGNKRFSPEAYGDFPVVDEKSIANLRKDMQEKMADEEWEVLEDVVEK